MVFNKKSSDVGVVRVESIDSFHSNIAQELLVSLERQVLLHVFVGICFCNCNLQVSLLMGQIGFQSGIHFSFSVINHDRCCNSGLSNLSLHINNDIRLSLLNSDLILESHVGCSKSIFESLRQISLTQLERLNSRIALNQKNILEFVLHIHSYTGQVSEEHTSCKLTRLIIH